jgi:hypothetical protein
MIVSLPDWNCNEIVALSGRKAGEQTPGISSIRYTQEWQDRLCIAD